MTTNTRAPRTPPTPPVPRLRLTGGIVPGSHRGHYAYSVRQLLRVMAWVKAHPDGVVELAGMVSPAALTAAQWRAWFRERLDVKINRGLPYKQNGRKWQDEWWWEAWRTAQAVNTPRLAIRWLPLALQTRLAHRLSTREE